MRLIIHPECFMPAQAINDHESGSGGGALLAGLE